MVTSIVFPLRSTACGRAQLSTCAYRYYNEALSCLATFCERYVSRPPCPGLPRDLPLAHLRATTQGVCAGLKRGLGQGLGAILGGVLYSSLGARACFTVCCVLPSASLLLLIPHRSDTGGDHWEEAASEEGLEGWGGEESQVGDPCGYSFCAERFTRYQGQRTSFYGAVQ